MWFEILGSMRVTGSRTVAITARREQVLLAMLLLHFEQCVQVERLVDAVWADDPPRDAQGQIQGSVYRLRKRLGAAGINDPVITEPGGYRIRVDPQSVDLWEFRRLRAEARAAASTADRDTAARQYRAALSLWRGAALTGVSSVEVQRAATALDEELVQAQQECIEVELALGKAGELVAELTELVQRHPYRERLHAALMRALYSAGRQADALAAFRQARQILRDELGTEPSPTLQRLHQAILNRDPTLDVQREPAGPPRSASHVPSVPRELPADVAGFTGRVDSLHALDEILAAAADGSTTPVVISAIAGTAGIGKTALAVHWSHQVADRFPDGQIYLNLSGYASVPPVRPIEALAALLRSLGTPPEQISTDEAQAAALYRSQVADRRVLVVLDNAGSAEQVRPLLPGSPSCLVLVTSRDRLTGLVARDGARRLTLDVLTPDEADTLLTHLLGAERINAEPDAVTELAAACAYLPLALRIAAASIADHPARTIDGYVDQLLHGDRLASLQAEGDKDASLFATLDLSYQILPPEAARLYRLLSIHSGPHIDVYAAAALANADLVEVRGLIDRLLSAHLLREPTGGRWIFHDLVRDHAAHTVATTDTENERREALRRLLDYYRHTTSTAMDTTYHYERERRPRVPATGHHTPDLSDPTRASRWLEAELPNLLAIARHTGGDWPEHTWHLSATLHRHLHSRGRSHDAEALHRQALSYAQLSSHQPAKLAALAGLGEVLRLQGRYEQAIDHHQQALEIARSTGNRIGEMDALIGLGDVYVVQGKHQWAIDQFDRALEVARGTGSRIGEMDALIGLGWGHEWQGRYAQAVEHYRPALEIARAIGNHTGEMEALSSLGHIRRLQGRHDEAIDHFEQTLDIARATAHRPGEMAAMSGLGDIRRLQGRHDEAFDHFEQALEIARAIAHRTGELTALRGLAYILRRQGRHEQATNQYQQVLGIAQEIGDRNWQFEALQGLGRTQYATNQPERALAHYLRALKLATDLGQPADQARAHDGIAHAERALGQYPQARRHWQKAADILVSLGTDHTDDEEATLMGIGAHLAAIGSNHKSESEPQAQTPPRAREDRSASQ